MECADRLAAAGRDERRLFELFEALDHEPPPLDWEAVRSAASRSDDAPDRSRARIAAGLALLVIGAAALAAIPGTPVRGWLESVLRDGPASTGPASPGEPVARSGIAVVPADPFEVAFMDVQSAGGLRVSFVDSDEVELTVSGAPVGLESGSGRLVVSNAGSSAGYELRVPRSLATFRVTVTGETVLEKRGDAIEVSATRDAGGAYVVDLSGEGR